MSFTLQEFLDKGVDQATLGLQPQDSAALDAEGVAESLVQQVFYDAAQEFAREGKTLPKSTKTLTFVNGTATLTGDVLTGSIDDSVLYDAADPTKLYALVPHWEDFINTYDTRLGYYTVRGGTAMYVIEPGSTYVEADGLDGDLKLVVAGVPAVPATASTTIDAPDEFVVRALDLLVERLRGREAVAA